MKLIIDIDEEQYKEIIENDYIYSLGESDLVQLENKIYNGKPLQAELEEIKEKIIKRKCKYCDTDANIQKCLEEHNSICDVNDFLVILDNYINKADCDNDCEHCTWAECPKEK